MSKRKYPCVSEQKAVQAPKGAVCDTCVKEIAEGSNCHQVTTQTSWFRGDDDVAYRHFSRHCPASKNYGKPVPVRDVFQRLRECAAGKKAYTTVYPEEAEAILSKMKEPADE